MTVFEVWDAMAGGPENGDPVEAPTPIRAAEIYAELDVEGHASGRYSDRHPIAVRVPDLGGPWPPSQDSIAIFEVTWVEHPPWWVSRSGEAGVMRAMGQVMGDRRIRLLAGGCEP